MDKHKDLKVWQRAVELVVFVYSITAKFPEKERFGLTSQINRSAVSIASNIAEGAGRNTNKYFLNFLSMANGSSFELDTQLIIANKLGYISVESFNKATNFLDEIQKMIYAFRQTLNKNVDTKLDLIPKI